MTKQCANASDSADRPALQIEITPEMIEAGADALIDMVGDDFSNTNAFFCSSYPSPKTNIQLAHSRFMAFERLSGLRSSVRA